MKLLIYTLPFNGNFGGILQAFALKEILQENGHQIYFLNRRKERKNRIAECLVWLKWCLSENILYKMACLQTIPFFGVIPFKIKYLHISKMFFKRSRIVDYCKKEYFDGYIVGSDQIWRYDFSPDIRDSFLYFAKDISGIKISYAASFGSDVWSYPFDMQEVCKKLLKNFQLVTVREDSGVLLCRKYFNSNAYSVLDPTLLINKRKYEKVINENMVIHRKGIFCYILDHDEFTKKITNEVSSFLNKDVFCMDTSISFIKYLKNLNQRICMTVPQWLSSFRDADFVVTDSFHGTVFSIIFNKPFVTIANSERGLARFQSLLSKLGLQNRLLLTQQQSLDEILRSEIDWEVVERKHFEYASYSKTLLLKFFNP